MPTYMCTCILYFTDNVYTCTHHYALCFTDNIHISHCIYVHVYTLLAVYMYMHTVYTCTCVYIVHTVYVYVYVHVSCVVQTGGLSHMKEYQRFMRLQHLLQKSSIYSKFLLERMGTQIKENKKVWSRGVVSWCGLLLSRISVLVHLFLFRIEANV